MKPKTELMVPDTREISQKASTALQFATDLVVDSQELYECGAEYLSVLKGLEKQIEDTFDGPIKAAHEAHKAILAAKAKHFEPLNQAGRIVKGKMIAFRDIEEKRLREEAERLRQQALKAEEEARNREAEELVAQGRPEEALKRLESPEDDLGVIFPPPEPARTKGIETRTIWRYDVTDISKLPREYMMQDDKKIGAIVKALGESTNIPGVHVYSERIIAVTSR